jgi:hypothetical protein
MSNAKTTTAQKAGTIDRDSVLKAREEEGLKALRKLQKLLTKKDLINIEKSAKQFHNNFRLG